MNLAMLSPSELLDDPFFVELKAYVIDLTGLAYYASQDLELARHIFQRLVAKGLSDCSAYWRLLHDHGMGDRELDLLVDGLTIGETFFFRHQEQFNALRERVIPDVIERNRSCRRLRIWSAGCATGAEPYSLAILLKQGWGELLAGWDVSILGTDINRTFLAQAQRGTFSDWALRATPQSLQTACFVRSGTDWEIRPEYRQWVSFRHHNLVLNPFPSSAADLASLDIILCRNVMIYFDQDVIRRVVGRFHESLVDDGWLLVGHAECQNELFPQFKIVNGSETVCYQRRTHEKPTSQPGSCSAASTKRYDASSSFPHRPLTEHSLGVAEVVSARTIPEVVVRATANGKAPSSLTGAELLAQRRKQLADAPLNPQLHFDYALLLQELDRHGEAEQALRRALYLDRNFILAHLRLGRLLQRRGDLAGAKRCCRNTLQLLNTLNRGANSPGTDGLNPDALAHETRRILEAIDKS